MKASQRVLGLPMTVVSSTALYLLVVFPIPSLNTEFFTILCGYLLALFLPGLLTDLVFGWLARGREEDIASKCGGLQYGGYLIGMRQLQKTRTKLDRCLYSKVPKLYCEVHSTRNLTSRSRAQCRFLGGQHSGVQDCPIYNERWGKYMYRYVLQYLREHDVPVTMVETNLDDPHIPARKAYEGVGFDRQTRIVLYWQDLRKNNLGSVPEDT